jgi:hypothetical protein
MSADRRRLQLQLERELAAADAAEQRLRRVEAQSAFARPFLRGAVDLADGVLGLPRLLASAPVAGYNVLTGSTVPLPISQSVADINPGARNVLAARNDQEHLATGITRGLGGALFGAGAGGLLGATGGAGSTVANVGRTLAANPVAQVAGAVTGAASAEAVRRRGGGAAAQLAAGIAGGLAPGVAQGAASALRDGADAMFDITTVGRGSPIAKNQEVVYVNPKALINAHRATDPDYASYDRVQSVRAFAAKGNKLSLPEADVVKGKLAFTNGRNRAKLAEEAGLQSIPVAVTKGTAAAFKKRVAQFDTGKKATSQLEQIAARKQTGDNPVEETQVVPDTEISASSIVAPHEPTDAAKLSQLERSMRDVAWHGRPIPVFEGAHGITALTGSHRIAAAKSVGMKVPVYKVDGLADFEDASGRTISDVLGYGDDDLLRFSKEFGEKNLSKLLLQEINAQ